MTFEKGDELGYNLTTKEIVVQDMEHSD